MERDVDNLFRCGVDRVSFSRHDIKTEDHSLSYMGLKLGSYNSSTTEIIDGNSLKARYIQRLSSSNEM